MKTVLYLTKHKSMKT